MKIYNMKNNIKKIIQKEINYSFNLEDTIIKAFIVKSYDNIPGVLYINRYFNEIDNHCEQCMNEIISWFGFNGESLGLKKILIGEIGTDKYDKYKDNMSIILGKVEILEEYKPYDFSKDLMPKLRKWLNK